MKKMKKLQFFLCGLVLLGLANPLIASTTVASFSFSTGELQLPAVAIPKFGVFEMTLNLSSNKAPGKFVLKEVKPAPADRQPVATFSIGKGNLHIPFVAVTGGAKNVSHFYVDMDISLGSEPLELILRHVVLAKTLSAFELLATKPHSQTDIASKIGKLETILTAIATAIDKEPDMHVAVGTKKIGKLGTQGKLLPFPSIDYNMDGTPDEAGRMLEFSFNTDSEFLNAGLGYGIALPWQIAAYTEGKEIKVVAGVPQTVVRTYFKDAKNIDRLMTLARQYQSKIEKVVAEALKPLSFKTHIDTGIENTQLGQMEMAAIETQLGEKLNYDFVAPTLTITDKAIDTETVLTAIEKVFETDEVSDLNNNGKAGEEEDAAVLPKAVKDYLAGKMTFKQLSDMLKQGTSIWNKGGAFQNWEIVRVMKLSDDKGGHIEVMELCQPFYAGMALGFGLYHMPSLPCTIGVWKDSKGVHVNMLSTQFIFGYFFADATQKIKPDAPIMRVFNIFPTVVYNELVSLINSALRNANVKEQFKFKK